MSPGAAHQLDDLRRERDEQRRQRDADPEAEPERLPPSRLAVRSSPAPDARPTCAVVPYWRKLKIAKSAAEDDRGDPERGELRAAEVADDRRVDEDVERLGRERAERRHREPEDLAVVLGAKPQRTRAIAAS